MILFTAAMQRAALEINGGVTLRVLLLLPNHLNFTDFRRIRTVDLAAKARTDSGTVSRALAELLKRGFIEREGTGTATAWRMSSDWGWNGTPDQWHAFRAGRMKGKKPPANDRVPVPTPPAQTRLRLLEP